MNQIITIASGFGIWLVGGQLKQYVQGKKLLATIIGSSFILGAIIMAFKGDFSTVKLLFQGGETSGWAILIHKLAEQFLQKKQ